ncbi:unnamed protein product [Schistosoma haematobium]|nr:unnamed protein product [Schistosoma haematobium]
MGRIQELALNELRKHMLKVTDLKKASSSEVSKINLETQVCELESQLNAEKRKSEENVSWNDKFSTETPILECICEVLKSMQKSYTICAFLKRSVSQYATTQINSFGIILKLMFELITTSLRNRRTERSINDTIMRPSRYIYRSFCFPTLDLFDR